MRNCVLFILCTFASLVQCYYDWEVHTAQGYVLGHRDPEGGLYVFYNIPYATAPTGTDRFKAPLAPPVFLSTFNAVDRDIICPQPNVSNKNMREDCLVANLFIPVPRNAETKLSVLVVIHSGAYQYGFGLQDQFRKLAKTKNIIVVTFNYRLGVHGFLCLGTESAPGNAGLKDQVALLRWVNTNIANFGGNSEDITLAGCRAGSGSVDLLTLSSITKGLFKKAIMESGVSTGAVGVQIQPIENAKSYAKLLGFKDVDDLNKLEEFYKTATFQKLTSRHEVLTNNQDSAIRFGPCVENDIGQERVVSNVPFSVMKQGNYTKIPLMYGFTNMDGEIRLPFFEIWKDQMNDNFTAFLPAELHFDNKEVKEEVARKVKQFYFIDDPIGQKNIQTYITYFTDILFGYPMLRSLTTRRKSLKDTIYLFEYSFVNADTSKIPKFNIEKSDDHDLASHCPQFIAVMDEDVTKKTEAYKNMKQILREYWYSFITTGSPSHNDPALPKWRPANSKRSPYMSLGKDIEQKEDILKDTVAFWDSIYEKHYRGPVMPPSDLSEMSTIPTTSNPTSPDSNTFDPTNSDATSLTTSSSTTIAPTTESDPGSSGSGADSLMLSNVIFIIVSQSLYFIFTHSV